MYCNTRPKHIDCACGAQVKVNERGPLPYYCMECRGKAVRPTQVECLDCKQEVPVKPMGPLPMRCGPCQKKVDAKLIGIAKGKRLSKRGRRRAVRTREDPRELGPARPTHGMTDAEYFVWRDKRFVELHREEGLPVGALAERFNVDTSTVRKALNKAGLTARSEGFLLPAGLPVL